MDTKLPLTQEQWNHCILHRQAELIVINKPPGLALQSRQPGDVVDLCRAYEKGIPAIVHRIDQPCSGLVVIALSKKKAASLSEAFRSRSIKKTYLAIVGTKPDPETGLLVHHLTKSKAHNYMHVVPAPRGKRAELEYSLLASSDNYHLLQVELKTGRQHQIRAQLAAIGCPIKGDNKYGFKRSNKDRSIHLHSWKMSGFALGMALKADPPDDPLWQYFQPKLFSTDGL